MSFAWPHLLWTLLIPCALAVREFAHRHRAASRLHPKILRAEAGPHSLRLAEASGSPARPRLWLCAGLALSLLALARPQWGRLEEPVFDQAREILLAVDLSRSMLTPDVKPSRLDRTKLLIQALLEKLAGERVGLVVFAGTSFLQAPLSADYEILREFLPALGPDFLPQGGTHYGAMLDTSLQAFGSSSAADRFLVVLSDGEATDSEWRTKVDELKKKNIRVISLGVGTAAGGMIPDNTGGFVKDERGAVVLSRLESGTLQDLARTTGGTYRDASAWIDLADLVSETIETGRKGDFVEKNLVRLVERFQWPLALGLWCLLVSFYHEFPVRPRPRDLKLPPSPPTPPRPATATTASTLALVLLLGLATSLPPRALAQSQPPAPPPPPEALTKIVTRLASAESHSPQDWAEFGRETAAWGSRLQSAQQPVPEGPVRDALQAVDIGSRQSPASTDWKKLREDLEALLEKPEDKQQEQEQPKDQPPQDQQNKDQKQQNQSSDQQQQSQEQKQDGSPKSDQSQQSSQPSEQRENQNPGDSPLGDMDQKQPPPPENNTRKVGGTPEGKSEASQAPTDPSLALPMQKLEQLRAQDSPAQLFQMMDGPKKPATKTGKDW